MSFLNDWSHRLGRERVKALYLGAGVLFLAVLAGFLFKWYQVPPEVHNPSLVLAALKPEKTVGDVWGFEHYLARKNAQLLNLPLPKLKTVMTGLFAEKILETSAWERPLGDIQYSFYALRQEANQRNRTATALLIDLKEALSYAPAKGAPLGEEDVVLLKALREAELRDPSLDRGARYGELLAEDRSDAFHARLLAREAALTGQKPGSPGREDLQELGVYDQKKVLPFYLSLTARELRQGPAMGSAGFEAKVRSLSIREHEVILNEYRQALGLLAVRNYSGFVGKADAMVTKYPRKDFAPVLLYQMWGVLKYDLREEPRAEKVLFRLKKEYPSSDLAYPEKAQEFFSGEQNSGLREMIPRGSGLERIACRFNVLRGFFGRIDTDLLVRIKRVAAGMTEGQKKEEVLRPKDIKAYLESFFPVFLRRLLSTYRVGLDGEEIKVFLEVKFGFTSAVISGKGAAAVEGGVSSKVLRLRLREIRLQGIPVPGLFLRQIESDFERALNSTASPLEFSEIRYSAGEVRVLFRKKAELVLSETGA